MQIAPRFHAAQLIDPVVHLTNTPTHTHTQPATHTFAHMLMNGPHRPISCATLLNKNKPNGLEAHNSTTHSYLGASQIQPPPFDSRVLRGLDTTDRPGTRKPISMSRSQKRLASASHVHFGTEQLDTRTRSKTIRGLKYSNTQIIHVHNAFHHQTYP
jgi:hypothetical protein